MAIHKTFLAGAALSLAATFGSSPAQAERFVVETGIEALSDPQTTIEGLHRLYIGRRFSDTFSFGQGVYSAALGDAGGAFFWGFEGVARFRMTQSLGLSFAGFVGGGGGAAQVIGDGLMLRAGVSLDYRLSSHWDAQLTASWISIDGAPIDGPAYGLGVRYRIGGEGAPAGSTDFDAISVFARHMVSPAGTQTRPGGPQPDVSLVGAQVFFDMGPRTQLTFGAAGAARGAQGYMQIMAGVRQTFALQRLSFFAEGGAGFAGGGNVDTGAGLLLQAALGVSAPITRTLDAELSIGAVASATGEYRAGAVTLGMVRHFNRNGDGPASPQRWAYTGGISVQQTDASYFINPGPHDAYTVMQQTSFDYFLGERVYVSGSALTALQGGVAGYALGMVGLGYEFPINDRWSVSVEGLMGAAGGGGVNTAGGIVAGLNAEVDYRVGQTWRLSAGVGQLTTLRSGGMSPMTFSLGVKIPFTTHN